MVSIDILIGLPRYRCDEGPHRRHFKPIAVDFWPLALITVHYYIRQHVENAADAVYAIEMLGAPCTIHSVKYW